jgi:DNA-binding CsgD family transcriptional regulator
MLGAEEALRAEAGFVLTPVERADIERSVGIVRGRLTSERFEAAWQAGRAMSLDEVAVLAGAVELSEPANAHEVRLSPRERDVALLAARGMTNQQIAATLGMSVRTAETHIGNVFRKLDLSSRRELHTWAVEHGLLASQVPVTRDT